MTLINLIFVICLYINDINYIYFITYPQDGLITEYNIQYTNDSYPINSSSEYQEEWLREKSLYYK